MDELDAIEAQVKRGAQRKRWVLRGLFALFLAVVLGPCVITGWGVRSEMKRRDEDRVLRSHRATDEQIAEVDRAIAAAEARLPERVLAWRAAMAEVRRVGPTEEACPLRLPLRQQASAERGASVNNLDRFDVLVFPGRQAFPHAILGRELPDDPPRVAHARERMKELAAAIRAENTVERLAQFVEAAKQLEGPFWTHDVVVVPRVYVRPQADPTGISFTAGALEGVAVLYDYASNSLLCAGPVSAATTSESVEYRAQLLDGSNKLASMLDAEFDAEIERAIATGLRHRAAPLAP